MFSDDWILILLWLGFPWNLDIYFLRNWNLGTNLFKAICEFVCHLKLGVRPGEWEEICRKHPFIILTHIWSNSPAKRFHINLPRNSDFIPALNAGMTKLNSWKMPLILDFTKLPQVSDFLFCFGWPCTLCNIYTVSLNPSRSFLVLLKSLSSFCRETVNGKTS